jgi:protein-tyrosine phosphatase
MGEVLLRDRLTRAGVDARVHSAGLISEGAPASSNGVKVMAKRGLDLSGHRSQPLTAEAVARADLIIGMAREHVREAVVLEAGSLGRTFTLPELARRARWAGPRSHDAAGTPEPFATWLARVGAGRRPADLLGSSTEDDVADPIGLSKRTYERTAQEIEDLVDTIVGLAFPVTAGRS